MKKKTILLIIVQFILVKSYDENGTEISNTIEKYSLDTNNRKLNLNLNPNSEVSITISMQDCMTYNPTESYYIFVQQIPHQFFKSQFCCSKQSSKDTSMIYVTETSNITISKEVICDCQNQLGEYLFHIQNDQQNQIEFTLNLMQNFSKNENSDTMIYIFIFVSLGILIIILCVSCYFCHFLDKRRTQIRETKKSLDKLLPLKLAQEVQQHQRLSQSNECLICLTPWDPAKSQVRVTPCYHVFHGDCIDKWWLKSKTCPCCRADLTVENMEKNIKDQKEQREKSSTQNPLQVSKEQREKSSTQNPLQISIN